MTTIAQHEHFHLIGIGGIGMSCIAQLLLKRGKKVTGSDVKESALVQQLRQMGAQVAIGHSAGNAAGAQVVIYSSAVKEDNPELSEGRRTARLVLRRAEALAELMEEKKVVAVAGSHGKTTTTSMVSYLLREAGLKPTVAIGGIAKNFQTNACTGEGDYFVAEADESDGTFLCYRPTYSVVTNIDKEHLDYYREFEREVEAFAQFLRQTKPAGRAFLCSDDPYVRAMLPFLEVPVTTFGLDEHTAQVHPRGVRMEGLRSSFECVVRGASAGTFDLALAGMHNVSNSLAVIALGLELGIDPGVIRHALSTYQGAGRRIDVKYSSPAFTLIDDYAHHPTEIMATLAAVRQLHPRRLVVVFQPHRYTRTRLLLEEFSRCFAGADHLVLTDIYAASEAPIEGVSAQGLLEKVREAQPGLHAEYVAKPELFSRITGLARPGDVVVTLGAGDIVRICDEMAEYFTRQRPL